MLKKIAIGLLVSLVVAAAGGYLYWRLRLRPWMLVEATRYGQIQGLGTAVISFHESEKKMPKNLEQLVLRGYLPADSELCFDPLEHGSMEKTPVSWKRCEFDFAFEPKSVTISVPPRVVAAFPFPLSKHRTEWTVTDDLSIYR